jgi:hypothetical protein
MKCPFCGRQKVKLSCNDIAEDGLRVELYCDNPDCEVREFTILPLRLGQRIARADVGALQFIDRGDDSGEDDHMAPGELVRIMEHNRRVLSRRNQDADVEVRPRS